MTGQPGYPPPDDHQAWVDGIREENLARAARHTHPAVPPELWPDRIGEPVVQRYGLDVWMRAEFGGTTVTVHRSGLGAHATHTITSGDGHTLDDRTLGAITAHTPPGPAGDRHVDAELGGRMRQHLHGLVDVIAAHHINTTRTRQLSGQVRACMSGQALAEIAGVYQRTTTREM